MTFVSHRTIALMGCALVSILAYPACSSSSDTPRTSTGPDTSTSLDGGTSNDDDAASSVSPEASASPEASTVTTLEGACRASVLAQCERRAECGNSSGAAQCLAYADLCPEYYFSDGATRTLEGAIACAETIRKLPCTDLALNAFPACLSSGKRTAGQACAFGSQCESSVCAGGNLACGTCTPLAAAGESCAGNASPCKATDYCSSVGTFHCVPVSTIGHGALGAACNLASEPILGCEGDLICAVGGTTGPAGTCQPLPAEGMPCVPTSPNTSTLCAKGLACRSQGDGTSACVSENHCGAAPCDSDSYCDRQNGPEKCVRFAKLGEACGSGSNPTTPVCDSTGICAYPLDGGTTTAYCQSGGTGIERGGTCDGTHTCQNMLHCMSGKCAPLDVLSCGSGGGARDASSE